MFVCFDKKQACVYLFGSITGQVTALICRCVCMYVLWLAAPLVSLCEAFQKHTKHLLINSYLHTYTEVNSVSIVRIIRGDDPVSKNNSLLDGE